MISPEARIQEFLDSCRGRRLHAAGPGGNGDADSDDSRARLELALFLENEFPILLSDVELDSMETQDAEAIASLVRRHMHGDGGY